MSQGYNTPVWAEHSNGTSTFYEKSCKDKYDSTLQDVLIWEYMHHWPAFPSTGIGEKGVICERSTFYYSRSWPVESGVDYSVEYRDTPLVNNVTYKVLYPGS